MLFSTLLYIRGARCVLNVFYLLFGIVFMCFTIYCCLSAVQSSKMRKCFCIIVHVYYCIFTKALLDKLFCTCCNIKLKRGRLEDESLGLTSGLGIIQCEYGPECKTALCNCKYAVMGEQVILSELTSGNFFFFLKQ